MEEITSYKQNDSKFYTILEIAQKKYAIEITAVLELLKVSELDYPEVSASCVAGVLQYKNKPISIIDLRGLLNKKRTVYGVDSRIVVVKDEDYLFGIICDSFADIKKIENKNINNIPYKASEDYFFGIFIEENENYYILNTNAIKNAVLTQSVNLPAENVIASDDASKKILKERKNKYLAQTQYLPKTFTSQNSGIVFVADDAKYYVDIKSVSRFEKLKNSKLISVPCIQEFIRGIVSVRGEYITVLDIKCFYDGVKTAINDDSILIVLNSNEFKMGFLADSVCEDIDINHEEILKNKTKMTNSSVYEFVKDDEIYGIIDVEALLKDTRLVVV